MSESDDERRAARLAILQRRSKLVWYAVAAGVATSSCFGKTVCLSYAVGGDAGSTSGETGGNGGTTTAAGTTYCLSAPLAGSVGFGGSGELGGVSFCLSGGSGGTEAGGVAGAPPTPCLSGAGPDLAGGAGQGGNGEGGPGGAGGAGEGGVAGGG